MSEPEKRLFVRPVGGIDDHVGPARLRVGSAPELETFSRGIGRNRVALLVTDAPALGDRVRFEVEVDGGTVKGAGHVERVHAEGGELWAVIDFEEVQPTGIAHLVRTLFRSRGAPAVRPAHYEVPDRRPPKVWPEPDKPTTRRKRPQVTRWEAPGATERFKRNS
jgi:hypothetical protein